jgi:general secretion pathway protein K
MSGAARQGPAGAWGPTTPERQRGIALVLVLWVIAMMTAMALALTTTVRTESQLVRNRVEEARSRAYADAAVAMAIMRFGAGEDEDRWWPDGAPYVWSFAGQALEVRVYNESSRIDLNGVSPQVLRRLLEAVGVDEVESERLAAAIEDWRDRDDASRTLGAEDLEYRAAGRPYGSRNGPFASSAELTQVLGMTPALYRALAPYVTVAGSGRRVDLEYASPQVQAAVGDERSARAGPSGRGGLPFALPRGEAGAEVPIRGLGGPLYRVRVAPLDGGPSVETLLRLGSRRSGVAEILGRRLVWQAPPEASAP